MDLSTYLGNLVLDRNLRGVGSTTVAAGSNAVNTSTFAGAGTLNVADATGFTAKGFVIVHTATTPAVIQYTGTTGTTFTGCTTISGGGVLATGGLVASTPAPTVYLSAHTADPGLTGASEVGTAGSNGYARQAVHFAAAASKSATSDGTTAANATAVQITMPSTLGAATAVPWLGLWDAATAGNFLGRFPIGGTNTEVEVAASTDLFVTGAAHGYAADDRVVFEPSNIGPALPTGVAASTIYYVLASGLTTTAFKVSTTSGGTALDVTADGSAIVRKLSVQTFNPSNILQVSSGQLSLAL